MRSVIIRFPAEWHEAMVLQNLSLERVGMFYHAVYLYATKKALCPELPPELTLLFGMAKAYIDAYEPSQAAITACREELHIKRKKAAEKRNNRAAAAEILPGNEAMPAKLPKNEGLPSILHTAASKENTPKTLKEKSVSPTDQKKADVKNEEQLRMDERMHKELSASPQYLQVIAQACECSVEDVSYVLQAFLNHTKTQTSDHSHTGLNDYYKHLIYWINRRKSYIPTIISYGKLNNNADTTDHRATQANSPEEGVLSKKDYSRGFFGG